MAPPGPPYGCGCRPTPRWGWVFAEIPPAEPSAAEWCGADRYLPAPQGAVPPVPSPVTPPAVKFHLLDATSYGSRLAKEPPLFTKEPRPDLFVPKKRYSLPVLRATEAHELEEELKRKDPRAFAMFERIRWQFSERGSRMSASDFLEVIAETTRTLRGKRLYEDRISPGDKSPLEYLISDLSYESSSMTREMFEAAMQTACRLVQRDPRRNLYDLIRFPTFLWSVGYHSRSGFGDDVRIPDDPVALEALRRFYETVPPASWVEEEVASLYKRSPDPQTFAQNLDAFAGYMTALEGIRKGLSRHNSGVVLLREVGDEVTPEALRRAAGPIVRFFETLATRGERHLGDAMRSFNFRGTHATDDALNKILALHQNFGILNISRLQEKGGNGDDFDLAETLLQNADPSHQADRPLAVVFVARKGNFIFDTFSMGNFYKNLRTLSLSYKLVVYEVASEEGVVEAMRSASRLTRSGKASLAFFAGHGDPESTNLGYDAWETFQPRSKWVRGRGAIPYGNTLEEMHLDIRDADLFAAIEPYLAPDAVVIDYSCETGGKAAEAVNMANSTAYYLPGRRVFAPTHSTVGTELTRDPNGLVQDVTFLYEEDKQAQGATTYRVLRPL